MKKIIRCWKYFFTWTRRREMTMLDIQKVSSCLLSNVTFWLIMWDGQHSVMLSTNICIVSFHKIEGT